MCEDCRDRRAEAEDYDSGESYGPGPQSTRERPPSAEADFLPLLNLLDRPGTKWSAEVEVVGLGVSRSASAIGCPTDSYGGSAEGNGSIIVTPDATVDAEIKLSRMTSGSREDAYACRTAYEELRYAGAIADYSCGHHVHIDACRMAEQGSDVTGAVIAAAAALGASCDATLTALAAAGYREHREGAGNTYGGDWYVGPYAMNDRYKLHASRANYAISYGNPSNATVEYRLPNGTLYAERSHAHVALAAGLVDLASAAILDSCPTAAEAVAAAFTRLQGWVSPYSPGTDYLPPCYSEADGAAFLSRYLRLHVDSFKALALAAADSPASKQHKDVWAIAAASRKVA